MRNAADKKDLEYTQLLEEYKGYQINWAISPSRAEPGKWLGHYAAYKDEVKSVFGTVVSLQDNEAEAQNSAIRIAKAKVDEALGEAG